MEVTRKRYLQRKCKFCSLARSTKFLLLMIKKAIWMTITIIDIIGETAILLVTFWLVSQVQVPRRKKFSIFTYFTLRLT